MLQDIIEVNHQKKHRLYLKFEDGKEGIVDISQLIEFTGIFAKLQDINYFKTVKLNPEWGTIYWENGTDLETSPPCPSPSPAREGGWGVRFFNSHFNPYIRGIIRVSNPTYKFS